MKYFKIKKAFLSLFMSYIAFLMIPLIFALVLILYTDIQHEEKSEESVHNTLSQSCLYFEVQLKNMKLDALHFSNNLALKWLSSNKPLMDGGKDVNTVIELNNQLNSYYTRSTFYRDYSLILDNGLVFRSNGTCIGKEYFFTHYRNYNILSFEEWEQNSFCQEKEVFLKVQDIQISKVKERVLTYSYPIRNLNGSFKETDAAIQFLIYESTIKDIFSQLLLIEDSQLNIFDSYGNCIVQLIGGGSASDERSIHDMSLMIGDQGSFDYEECGQMQNLVYQKSLENKFVYSFSLPKAYVMTDAKLFRKYTFLLLGVSLLFELLLGFNFARKYTTPIKNMIANLSMFMKSKDEKMTIGGKEIVENRDLINSNEYEYLEKYIVELIQYNEGIEDDIQQRKAKAKVNFLSLLYNGEFRSDEEIRKEATNVGLVIEEKTFCSYIVKINEKHDKLVRLLNEVFQHRILAWHPLKEDVYVLLIQFERDETKEVQKKFYMDLREELMKLCEDMVYCGVGNTYINIMDISFSYKQAQYCLNRSVEIDTGILTYDEVEIKRNYYWYPTELSEKLQNGTKCGDAKVIEDSFQKIINENIDSRRLEPFMEKMLISSIASTLLIISKDTIVDKEGIKLIKLLEYDYDLGKSLDKLKEQFIEIGKELSKVKEESKQLYKEQLVKYIKENFIDSQLCVYSAANAFSLSESYFSQFFKNTMDDSFSNYLENMRLTKAKELMLTADVDLETIACMVGYNNSATFRRAFKRVNGIAPSTWQREKGLQMI